MDILKLKKIKIKTKIWIISLFKKLIKNGNYLKYLNILNKILFNISILYKNINKFFFEIDKNICLPIMFLNKRVAGKNLQIPYRSSKNKEIIFSIKIILNSLKLRSEKNFSDRLLNELLDIYKNKGFSIKKRLELISNINSNSQNIRFLKKK